MRILNRTHHQLWEKPGKNILSIPRRRYRTILQRSLWKNPTNSQQECLEKSRKESHRRNLRKSSWINLRRSNTQKQEYQAKLLITFQTKLLEGSWKDFLGESFKKIVNNPKKKNFWWNQNEKKNGRNFARSVETSNEI